MSTAEIQKPAPVGWWVLVGIGVIIIAIMSYLVYFYRKDWIDVENTESIACPIYTCKGPITESGTDYFAYRLVDSKIIVQKSRVGNLASTAPG